ncbi:hypothetical protein, partial [Serratia fonticola]
GFSLAEDTDDLFVGKTLLHGHVLMWFMKTLLTLPCINQLGAGQRSSITPQAGSRGTAINRAWGEERVLVGAGGGSRNWSQAERDYFEYKK